MIPIASAKNSNVFTRFKKYRGTPKAIVLAKIVRRVLFATLEFFYLPKLKKKYRHLKFGSYAIQKLIEDVEFETVLDVGSGEGLHSDLFLKNKKSVTAIDYGDSVYFRNRVESISTIVGDINEHKFSQKFDVVWCSHVLEHQLNVNSFLKKLYSLIENDGFLAITVPPARSTIVGGHLTNWNAGLLLYNLVLAGFDCSNAKVLAYGYNISIIVQKKRKVPVIPSLGYDVGDIRLIKPFLPQLKYFSSELDDPFFGYILIHNW